MNTIKTRKMILDTACLSGLEYFESHRTTKAAYENCTRPDWLIFGLECAGVPNDDTRYRDAAREIALQVFERSNQPEELVAFDLDSSAQLRWPEVRLTGEPR